MKAIIAGSRRIYKDNTVNFIQEIVDKSGFNIEILVCGMAHGVDMMAHFWARETGIPIKEFPADWDKYGKSAGPIRNQEMLKYADALIAIWDGESKGTKHMISIAKKKGIKVFIYDYK